MIKYMGPLKGTKPCLLPKHTEKSLVRIMRIYVHNCNNNDYSYYDHSCLCSQVEKYIKWMSITHT